MTDHRLDPALLQAAPAPQRPARALPLLAELPARAVWALVGIVVLYLAYYLWSEGAAEALFAGAVTAALGVLVVLACRRVLPAAVLCAALVLGVATFSALKQQATELLLHAWDIVAFFQSRAPMVALWREHAGAAIALLAALVATAAATWLAYRIDGTRVPRTLAAAALVACLGLAWAGVHAKGERRHTEYYFEGLFVSFFYASWAETLQALWHGRLLEAADHARSVRMAGPGVCKPAAKPPHIILIHQESVVPPSHFPTLGYDTSLDAMFQSFDGKLHKLKVETYGGASWLTEFSIFAGLPTRAFGGMQQYVQPMLTGKIRDTLPMALAGCGYRTVAFYPMLHRYLATGKFFDAVGFSQVFDAKDQGAKLANERDRFYYGNALAEMERHMGSSGRPLFTYIETMATHGPYDFAYMPEVDVPKGGANANDEMDEYLRRLAMARMDYAFLRQELARRFPKEQFLIVHYGDHQPLATRTLLGFHKDAWIEEVMASGNQAALVTYYAVDAIGYRPPPLPEHDVLEVPYLGSVVLQAARLPLPDTHRERMRLMQLCQGRYQSCPDRAAILQFHRSLIDGGLVDAM